MFSYREMSASCATASVPRAFSSATTRRAASPSMSFSGFYRDGTPYAATAAGNNKNLIFKFFHDLVLLLSSN